MLYAVAIWLLIAACRPGVLRIVPVCFQSGSCTSQNMSYLYLVLLYRRHLWVLLVNVCFCCVRFSFVCAEPRDWLGKNVSKMSYFI